MQNKTFKVSLLAMSLGLVNQAWATDLTCSNPTGCSYAFFNTSSGSPTAWYLTGDTTSSNTSITDSINVTVPAGNYQNVARTENGASEYAPGKYSGSSRSLFGIVGGYSQDNLLTLKTGVNAVLKEDYTTSQIVGAHNSKVVLEKGVNLSVEQNYSQIHNIPDAYGNLDGNSAIQIYNTVLDTQADIVLNNDGSDAINVQSDSTITSSNHNITMNGERNTAYTLYGKDVATIKNVNVTGNKNAQFVFDIGNDLDLAATVNADNLTVSLNDKSGLMINSDGATPTVNLNNSNAKAGYGLLAFPFGEKRTVNLNLQNSTLNATQALVSVNDKGFPFEDEDEDEVIDPATAELYQLNLTGSQNSKFTGAIIENPDQPARVEVNFALTDSQWNFNKSSQLNNLALSNSDVTFEPTSEFKTLTIKGDLSGSGNFTLNTDLASQQGDKIIVNGTDSGAFGLRVQDSGKTPNAANGSVTLVETQTGTAQFSLLGRDYVDAGAYRYRLQKSGNNWVLSNRSGESSTTNNANNSGNNLVNNNTNQTASNNNSQTNSNGGTSTNNANNGASTNTGSTVEQVALSGQSNALVSLRQAQLLLVEDNLAGLHQRLGELKKGEQGNVWVRNSNHRNKLGSLSVAENAKTSGFKQRVNSTQVGADFAATESIRIGGFVGNARSNVNFEGEYGSGKVRSQTVGLYGTYLADNGFYFDNVVKYERVKSKSNRTGERKYNGYTLSSEIGRIHTLGSWTITPQLQAAWTKLSGKSDEERLTALTARAGVRVANHLNLGEWQLQPYAEVNGITTKTNSNTVQVDGYRFDVAESRGRIQTALGVNAALGQHRVGLEGSVTNGKHLDQPYQIQAVYRYSW